MTIDIKHKHASHVIIIEGQAFKANDAGMWDLTDIWKALKLPKTKGPGKWAELKEAKRLRESRKVELSHGNGTFATKQATIRYAAWVSSEFEDVVYDAFEAVLEMAEVALLVADKMRSMGNDHSAAILERHVFNDKCDWKALRGPHKNSQKGLKAAVAKGNLTRERAAELGLKAI
ncbi:KilA-N domain-containing protein [Pseudomonas viridiflava]|uniref:KilA-N domain-containing protein n=1 Tax=Pseudomonas viridiflava TaxID=33069 RepID=UPI0013CEF71A|nr:KilA-N domain-containing protein [Pseudomonas viridiflava]